MSIDTTIFDSAVARGRRIHGAVRAVVTNNQDPDGLGRVKVRFLSVQQLAESAWARVAAPFAGAAMGFYALPSVNDEVLVLFEQGDVDKPYVAGALWNGKAKPPADNSDGKNAVRVIKSASGHVIRLDDTEGKEQIVICDKTGKNQITIDSASNTITLAVDQDLKLTANGGLTLSAKGDVKIDCANFTVTAQSKAGVTAQAAIALDCMAGVKLNTDGLVVT